MDPLNGQNTEASDPMPLDEDATTLAAIDAGIQAVAEGRVVAEEEVRKLIPRWISEFSTPSRR